MIRVRIAANVGAATEVPPTTVKPPGAGPLRNPVVQLGVIAPFAPSSEETRYPS